MMTTLGPHRHVSASIHDDGVVLLQTAKGKLFASNHTGARIWQGLERALPLDDIAADISRQYRIPHDTARDHATRFVAELERQRLIERRIVQ
jgi:hypothetical protein